MTKTLYSRDAERSNIEMTRYKKVTATKVEETERYVQNLYKDAEGNKYIVRYNRFQRRHEFVKIG